MSGLVGIEKCIFVPSRGALGFPQRSTRAVSVGCWFGPLLVLGCIGFCFWAPLYTYSVPRGIGGLGFLCILEALCIVLVYLEALGAFFWYNILTYQKKKKKKDFFSLKLCIYGLLLMCLL